MKYIATCFLSMAVSFGLLTYDKPNVVNVGAQVCNSYVAIEQEGEIIGAGTVIRLGSETFVLTAYHVVSPGYAVATGNAGRAPIPVDTVPYRVMRDSKHYDSYPVWFTPTGEYGGDDFALLALPTGSRLPAATLAFDVTPRDGETVWYVGSPAGFPRYLERSILSRTDYPAFDSRWLVFGGGGWYGNSGGGLYVERSGRPVLAGVVSRMLQSGGFRALMANRSSRTYDFIRSYMDYRGMR